MSSQAARQAVPAALAVALGLALSLPAAASAQVYGAAAIVDGRPVPRLRLERFVERYAASRGRSVGAIRSPAAYRGLVREALEVLVDDELLAQEAARRGHEPRPEEIEAQVAALRARYPTPAALDAWLDGEGLRPEELASQVRRQLAVRRLVEEELAAGLSVSDEEVHRHYLANLERFTSEAGLLPEAAVREQVRGRLLAERREEAVRARVAALRQVAVVRILPPYRDGGDP